MSYIANSAPPTAFGKSFNSALLSAVDIDAGYVLYDRRATEIYDYPASTVKMMTVLIASEVKSAVLTSEAVTWQTSDDLDPSYSQVGLANGDSATWQDMINAAMMVSAGDACQAMARVLGNEHAGNPLTESAGYSVFTQMMNDRMQQLGGTGRAVFADAHGAGRSLMSARDLALVAEVAFQSPGVVQAFASTTQNMTISGPNARTITLTNASSVAARSDVVGSKTGTLIIGGGLATTYNLATLWTSPSGNRVAIAHMLAATDAARGADFTAAIADLVTDFPYLA